MKRFLITIIWNLLSLRIRVASWQDLQALEKTVQKANASDTSTSPDYSTTAGLDLDQLPPWARPSKDIGKPLPGTQPVVAASSKQEARSSSLPHTKQFQAPRDSQLFGPGSPTFQQAGVVVTKDGDILSVNEFYQIITGQIAPRRNYDGFQVCGSRRCPSNVWQPLCDNLSRTHASECSFYTANCRALIMGVPLSITSNTGPCPETIQGSTFSNQLLLDQPYRLDQALSALPQPFILPVFGAFAIQPPAGIDPSRLEDWSNCERNCPSSGEQVCDNLGRVYQNHCFYEIAFCVARRNGMTLSIGQCGRSGQTSPFPSGTTSSLPFSSRFQADQPTLGYGQPGQQTSNLALGGPASGYGQQSGNLAISGNNRSQCPTACPQNVNPVCSNFGVQYTNDCFLRLAACLPQTNFGGRLFEGSCNIIPDRSCARNCLVERPTIPACDEYGIQYLSYCNFLIAQCFHELGGSRLRAIECRYFGYSESSGRLTGPVISAGTSNPLGSPGIAPGSTVFFLPGAAPGTSLGGAYGPSPGTASFGQSSLPPSGSPYQGRAYGTPGGPSPGFYGQQSGQTQPGSGFSQQLFLPTQFPSPISGGSQNPSGLVQKQDCERNCLTNDRELVCDDEGRQYTNVCYFSVAQCYARFETGRTLRIALCRGQPGQGSFLAPPPAFSPSGSQSFGSSILGSPARQPGFGPVSDSGSIYGSSSGISQQQSGSLFFQQPQPGYGQPGSQSLTTDNCYRVCEASYRPVCDHRGTTHTNECTFRIAQCMAERRGDSFAYAHAGACNDGILAYGQYGPQQQQQPLQQQFSSGYGSGQTGQQQGQFFQPISAGSNQPGYPGLTSGSWPGQRFPSNDSPGLIRTGSCVSVVQQANQCIRDSSTCRRGPVCGTDRQTYCTLCDLERAACQGVPGLGAVCERQCEYCPVRGGFHADKTRQQTNQNQATAD